MTTLLMATADLPLPTGSWTASSTQARTGSKSFYQSNALDSSMLWFPLIKVVTEVFYWRTCYMYTDTSNSRRQLYGRIRNTAGQAILTILGEQNLDLTIRQGSNTGIVLHTISAGIVKDVWQVVEVYCSATTVTVRFNGVEVYHNTGHSFTLTGLSEIVYSGVSTSSTTTWAGYIDDIVVCTDKWPGMGGLHVFTPTGPGTVTDWSGSLPNLNTPAAVSGTKHRFTHDNAPATAALVHRVGVGHTAKVNGQGYGAVKPLLNNDAGDERALSVSSQYFQQYWPGMSVADFNASEIGVQSA